MDYMANIEKALVSTSNPTPIDTSDHMKKAYPQFKVTKGDLELSTKLPRC